MAELPEVAEAEDLAKESERKVDKGFGEKRLDIRYVSTEKREREREDERERETERDADGHMSHFSSGRSGRSGQLK